jgi:uncharacterized RDD family membrane protein YckC
VSSFQAANLPAAEFQAPEWKQEISARVQAHRSRRQPAQQELPESSSRRNSRAAGVAATVAERYASALSYSEYLARLSAGIPLAEVEARLPIHGDAPADFHSFPTEGSSALDPFHDVAPEPENDLRVELAEDPMVSVPAAASTADPHAVATPDDFLQQVTVEPDVPLATKLIEFPRQLVAARRARPRLAEGPLRDTAPTEDAAPQLRIFEVEEEQISRQPLAADSAAIPGEWHYIQLDTPLLSTAVVAEDLAPASRLADVAPIDRRMMAAALDLAFVTMGFLLFAAAFVAVVNVPPTDSFLMISAGIVFAALYGGYQWLFLNKSDATPGMRYARIALCTFNDENPTVRARRSRLGAALLSLAAGGLGFVWMWFDQENLSWHDRMTRTYQRCY